MLQILLHEKNIHLMLQQSPILMTQVFRMQQNKKSSLNFYFRIEKKIYNMASEEDEQDPDITQVSWTRTACLESRTRKGSDQLQTLGKLIVVTDGQCNQESALRAKKTLDICLQSLSANVAFKDNTKTKRALAKHHRVIGPVIETN